MSQNISIDEAARLLGVSQDTVRRRIRNGELEAHQVARPQGYTWRVDFPDEPANEETAQVAGAVSGELLEALRDTISRQDETITHLRNQMEAKDKQLGEVHVLFQQAQAALPAPKENGHSWWQFWRG